MKLLTFQRFDVFVRLPPWEVCRRLLGNVSGEKPFRGEVQEESFKIYRNTFIGSPLMLRLHGVLEAVEGGTKIQVKMKIYMLIKLYVLFFISVGVGLNLTGKLNYKEGLIILSLIILIGYLVFWFDAKESKEAFMRLFEKDIAANQEDAPDHEAVR